MYSDEDLNNAVENGIFSASDVDKFRQFVAETKQTTLVDEENFRLLSGFNDIFVVIACVLLLGSVLAVFGSEHKQTGLILFTVVAWGLAEFFVRRRKLALPAIVLLLAFVGGAFFLTLTYFKPVDETSFMIATAVATLAAYMHWRQFRVPITVAAGAAALSGFVIFMTLAIFPGIKEWILLLIFLCGLLMFAYAMYWDMSDRQRVTRFSDVAFWLHLTSAPLIIHPIFAVLQVTKHDASLTSMFVVPVLYLLMIFISLVIDRRAFMVSSLFYVVFALAKIFESFGSVGKSFAITGIVIGSALLLLSAFWHTARVWLLGLMPAHITARLPVARTGNAPATANKA
ncbi:MAG: hypothetical protein OEZ39_00270 [Gammaproteobacteria bacterium]|nr:hypothetical protein [Gammaproteobacteria bacterium]MDH5650282.1 hypothetical protein [Gammaproteobacteria bacterium]